MQKKENKTRRRGDNWSQEEKDLLLEIMQQSALIVENKLTDTNTNRKKTMEWIKIQCKLRELTGKHRDVVQIRGFWRRSKIAAKKSISLHRQATHETGGGQKPPSPPLTNLKIIDLGPIDSVIDKNDFDSDSTSQIPIAEQDTSAVIIESESEITDDECIDQQEVSFVEDVVTVADIDIKTCGDNMTEPPNEGKEKMKKDKINETSKAVIEANLAMKKRTLSLLEEEFILKINYQKQEAAHQQVRHKLEIDNLLLEKEKKILEIKLLRRQLQE